MLFVPVIFDYLKDFKIPVQGVKAHSVETLQQPHFRFWVLISDEALYHGQLFAS